MSSIEGQIQDIREVFPGDTREAGQLMGALRVLVQSGNGVTPEEVVSILREDGAAYLPMTACDENGGVPNIDVVERNFEILTENGVLRRNNDGRYSFTDTGIALASKHDRREYSFG